MWGWEINLYANFKTSKSRRSGRGKVLMVKYKRETGVSKERDYNMQSIVYCVI